MKGKVGCAFEERIIKAKTGLSKSELKISNTNSVDIPAGIYKSKSGTKEVKNNVSCKSTKSSTVYCSDIIRFYEESTKQDYLEMVIGLYYTNPNKFHTIYVFKLNNKYKELLWGDIPIQELEMFVKYVKDIPKDRVAEDENRSIWKEKRSKIYEDYTKGFINIDAKIDSTNRRVQCSFNFNDLIEAGFPYEVYTEEYEGIPVQYEY